jgi:hypothetical protein
MTWLEPRVLKHASRVVAVSPGTHEILKDRYPWLDENLFSTIPIGVEKSDFRLLAQKDGEGHSSGSEADAIEVVYTGAVWYGAWPAVEAFLRALKKNESASARWFRRLKIHFVGTGLHKDRRRNGWVSRRVAELKLEGVVSETCKSQPYLDAISAMLRADALLLFGSPERYYMASKLFQYIEAARPIFAIVYSRSPMLPFLEACDSVVVVTYGEADPIESKVEEIATRFGDFIQSKGEHRTDNRCSQETFTGFTASRHFADVFSRVARKQM